MSRPAKKQKGPRARHVPQRTCVACRRSDAKRTLLRVVRDAAGRVAVDPSGKRNGRGAYLCADPRCWEQALRRGALERALRVPLQPEDRLALEEVARGLAPVDEPLEAESDSGS